MKKFHLNFSEHVNYNTKVLKTSFSSSVYFLAWDFYAGLREQVIYVLVSERQGLQLKRKDRKGSFE